MQATSAISLFAVRKVVLLHALFGFALAVAVVALLTSPQVALLLVGDFPRQVTTAFLVVVLVAWLGSKRIQASKTRRAVFWLSIALTVCAYLLGVLAGSLTHLLIFGDPFFREDRLGFFISPLLYFGVVGGPIALLIGLALGLNLRRRQL